MPYEESYREKLLRSRNPKLEAYRTRHQIVLIQNQKAYRGIIKDHHKFDTINIKS